MSKTNNVHTSESAQSVRTSASQSASRGIPREVLEHILGYLPESQLREGTANTDRAFHSISQRVLEGKQSQKAWAYHLQNVAQQLNPKLSPIALLDSLELKDIAVVKEACATFRQIIEAVQFDKDHHPEQAWMIFEQSVLLDLLKRVTNENKEISGSALMQFKTWCNWLSNRVEVRATEREMWYANHLVRKPESFQDFFDSYFYAGAHQGFSLLSVIKALRTLSVEQAKQFLEICIKDKRILELTDEASHAALKERIAKAASSEDLARFFVQKSLIQAFPDRKSIISHAECLLQNRTVVPEDFYLADHREINAVLLSLAAGADVNAIRRSGRSSLMCAAENGHTQVVRALIAAGADVDERDSSDNTALMCAAKSGHTQTAQALIAAGADLQGLIEARFNEYPWLAIVRNFDTSRIADRASLLINLREIGLAQEANKPDAFSLVKMLALRFKASNKRFLLEAGLEECQTADAIFDYLERQVQKHERNAIVEACSDQQSVACAGKDPDDAAANRVASQRHDNTRPEPSVRWALDALIGMTLVYPAVIFVGTLISGLRGSQNATPAIGEQQANEGVEHAGLNHHEPVLSTASSKGFCARYSNYYHAYQPWADCVPDTGSQQQAVRHTHVSKR